jgi:hypothetical protein
MARVFSAMGLDEKKCRKYIRTHNKRDKYFDQQSTPNYTFESSSIEATSFAGCNLTSLKIFFDREI